MINKLYNQLNWSLYIRSNLHHSFYIIWLCYLYIRMCYTLKHINYYSNKVSFDNLNIMFTLFLYRLNNLYNIKHIYQDFDLYKNCQDIYLHNYFKDQGHYYYCILYNQYLMNCYKFSSLNHINGINDQNCWHNIHLDNYLNTEIFCDFLFLYIVIVKIK